MAERTKEEWEAELQWAEETGNTVYAQKIITDVFGGSLPDTIAGPQGPAQQEPTFLDNWGRPIAEAGGSLAGGAAGMLGGLPGIMAGAALGGHAGVAGWDKLTGSPAPSPEQQVLSAGFNTMGGPTAPLRKGPAMLSDAAMEAFKPTRNPTAQQVGREVAERGGVTTPGQRGVAPFKWIEGALESSPFAGPIMERNRRQTTDIFGEIIDELTPTASSRAATGDAIAEGYGMNLNRAHAYVDDAYKTADDMMDRSANIPASALQDLSQKYKELRVTDGQFADLIYQDTDLARSIAAIDDMVSRGESPSYDVLKRLRTMIGKKIDFNSPGSEQVGLKDLYRTLSEDLREGAMEIGGENAVKAMDNADSMFSALQVQLKALDPVFKYADTPEKLYDALDRTLLHNTKLARSARTAMGENAWDQYRDTWIRNKTRATAAGQDLTGQAPSAHTTHSALANLKKQSPEGYALLTEGREEGIAVVEKLADMMKEGESFVNRSRTANAMSTSMFGGDIVGGTVGGLAGLMTGGPTAPMVAGGVGLIARPVISKLMAHALTSRRLNDALVKVGRKYDQLPVGKDLARALIAAGADQYDVNEIFDLPSIPEREAANVY